MNTISILLGALFAGLSAFTAYQGIKYSIQCARMFWAGRCAPGVVTNITTEQRSRKGRIRTTYTAVIAYHTALNEKREIKYANPIGSDAFKVGDHLNVWYDLNDPEIFALGGWHFVKDIASFFVFTLFLGLPGWGILWLWVRPFFGAI